MTRTRNSRKQGLAVEPLAGTPKVPINQSAAPDNAQSDLEGAKANNLVEGKPKAKVNKQKRKNEDVDILPMPGQPTQPPPAKRMKAVQPLGPDTIQPEPQRTVHPRAAKAAQTPQKKRKRRTKAEMLADKAKAEADRLQLQEEAKRNQERMVMMDIEEDVSRVGATVQIIRKFADIENDSGLEEFPGYHDIASDSDTGSEVELVEKKVLKVSKTISSQRRETYFISQKSNKSVQQTTQKSGGKTGHAGGKKEGLGGKKYVDSVLVYTFMTN